MAVSTSAGLGLDSSQCRVLLAPLGGEVLGSVLETDSTYGQVFCDVTYSISLGSNGRWLALKRKAPRALETSAIASLRSGNISVLSNTGVKYSNVADLADFRVHDCTVVAYWAAETCGSGSIFK